MVFFRSLVGFFRSLEGLFLFLEGLFCLLEGLSGRGGGSDILFSVLKEVVFFWEVGSGGNILFEVTMGHVEPELLEVVFANGFDASGFAFGT